MRTLDPGTAVGEADAETVQATEQVGHDVGQGFLGVDEGQGQGETLARLEHERGGIGMEASSPCLGLPSAQLVRLDPLGAIVGQQCQVDSHLESLHQVDWTGVFWQRLE